MNPFTKVRIVGKGVKNADYIRFAQAHIYFREVLQNLEAINQSA